MNNITIDSISTLENAGRQLYQLLDEGNTAGALKLAESLHPDPGQELHVQHFRGCAYVEIGGQLESIKMVERGVKVLSQLDLDKSATISYNLANAKSQLWRIAVRKTNYCTAWLEKRNHLHESRRILESVADDKNASLKDRLKALTDAGNSYDNQGRYLDALDCYDRALELDPTYGMALGNRGMALLFAAPLMGEHQWHTLLDAAASLEAAIENKDSVIESGGRQALGTFEKCRASISVSSTTTLESDKTSQSLQDRHLDWCRSWRLFLNVSPDCINDTTKVLDPVSFREMSFSLNDPRLSHKGDQLRGIKEFLGAYNAIKQDYMSARYLVWLTSDMAHSFLCHAQSVTRRAFFWDTLDYASWGVEPGIATIALKAAVDVLDKIAVFVHQYFHSCRNVRNVEFGSLPYKNRNRTELEPNLASALKTPLGKWNSGLIALFDLSSELEEQSHSHLKTLNEYRHAATHRSLIIHSELAPDSSEWSEHVSWSDITDGSLCLLRIARSAIFYLTHMIHLNEEVSTSSEAEASLPMTIPFPAYRSEGDWMEHE